MKVLITGYGLLGSAISQKALEKKMETIIVSRSSQFKPTDCNFVKMDITNRESVIKEISKLKPNCIFHTAALTNVDLCETNKEEAWTVNVEGTSFIAEAAERISAKMIYVSTDSVFDGKKGNYSETDKVNPINYYSKTKLAGEKEVIKKSSDWVIARTSVIYGWNPTGKKNFATWVISSLRNSEKIRVVTDQFNSPTFAPNLASALIELFNKDCRGLFHVAGSERISRYDFAINIAKEFELDSSFIVPVSSSELKQTAKRPKDISLNIYKIEKELRIEMLGTEEGLKLMKGEFNEGSDSCRRIWN